MTFTVGNFFLSHWCQLIETPTSIQPWRWTTNHWAIPPTIIVYRIGRNIAVLIRMGNALWGFVQHNALWDKDIYLLGVEHPPVCYGIGRSILCSCLKAGLRYIILTINMLWNWKMKFRYHIAVNTSVWSNEMQFIIIRTKRDMKLENIQLM